MKRYRGFVIVMLLFSTMVCRADNAALRRVVAGKYSGDILQKLKVVLPGVEFVRSSPGSFQTLLEARYRVPGTRAAAVEALLIRKYGMAPLRFACCGWESARPGILRTAEVFSIDGKRYSVDFSINMFSDESLVRDRSGWGTISNFTILVLLLHI